MNPEVKLCYEEERSGEALLIRMPASASYQVLRNIVENALKYTPEGGTVSLEHFIENGQVIVSVADTGMGVSSQQLPHIFDRFYRTEGSRNRTQEVPGLACHRQSHYGAVWGFHCNREYAGAGDESDAAVCPRVNVDDFCSGYEYRPQGAFSG